jgi:hypothetical protein
MHLVWEVAPHPQAGPDEGPGNWRRHNIQAFPSGMKPPDFTEVAPLMHDWVASVNDIQEDPAPIGEAVAARHATFERVHPFIDGNGRTGRLLVNLTLVRLGYPPAVIRKRDRLRYLRALARADGGDVGPLGELVAHAVLDSLYRFVVPAVAGPARLVPLEALARPGLSVAALRMAAARGRLQAVKEDDGRWRSSRRWVEEYTAHRYRRSSNAPPS